VAFSQAVDQVTDSQENRTFPWINSGQRDNGPHAFSDLFKIPDSDKHKRSSDRTSRIRSTEKIYSL